MKITTLLSQKSDNVGILSSALCLVHCTLLPVLVTFLPLASQFEFMDYIFWVFSLVAVYYSVRQTTHNGVRWAFYLAGLLFTCGILLKEYLPGGEVWAYAGSLCLICTHAYNLRYCKHCAAYHQNS